MARLAPGIVFLKPFSLIGCRLSVLGCSDLDLHPGQNRLGWVTQPTTDNRQPITDHADLGAFSLKLYRTTSPVSAVGP